MTAHPQNVDVLIMGAGINGAGLFRDLCEQGLTCVIIDKGDFGSGTSAAPSRLIHGGLKYLETGELRLVAQSTLERNLLLRNAPHYVEPLPTVIPIFSWLRGIPAAIRTVFGSTTAPRSRGAVLIKIGLAIYDFYGARRRVMPRHAMWSRSRALREIQPLTRKIVAAGTYFDAKVSHPERLVFELLRDGLAANEQSLRLNYTRLTSASGPDLEFEDSCGNTHTFSPRIVVNATGPWIDEVNMMLGEPSSLIGGTKGSHIVLDHHGLTQALNGRMIYFEGDDGRICLVYEFLGKALVGSSDIRASDPDSVGCDETEVDYFLDSLRSLFPSLAFDRNQIVFAYSGIRPLPASSVSSPGLISRDHSAPVAEPSAARPWPVVSLVGGKWTTFRGFAEEVANSLLARLGTTRRIGTSDLPIGGGRGFPIGVAQRSEWVKSAAEQEGADPARVDELLARYGTLARAILRKEASVPDQRLTDAPDYSTAEIEWLVRNEQVTHLDDIVMRRTTLAISGRLSRRDLRLIAEIASNVLNWDKSRQMMEIERTTVMLSKRNRIKFVNEENTKA